MIDALSAPRLRPLWVLAASGALGFRVGYIGFPTWHVVAQTAQVLAGFVIYPPDNPFYIYHTKLWTILHQIGAVLLRIIETLSAAHEMRVGVFGHAGDGNFHPTFVMDRDDPAAETRINAVRTELFRDVLALGGTISGEHGTGVAKRGYLEQQRGARSVAAMKAVKAALDPQGILNPGKVFAD